MMGGFEGGCKTMGGFRGGDQVMGVHPARRGLQVG
jgi:hypothetical protein